jgi:hypothetical protein
VIDQYPVKVFDLLFRFSETWSRRNGRTPSRIDEKGGKGNRGSGAHVARRLVVI